MGHVIRNTSFDPFWPCKWKCACALAWTVLPQHGQPCIYRAVDNRLTLSEFVFFAFMGGLLSCSFVVVVVVVFYCGMLSPCLEPLKPSRQGEVTLKVRHVS